MSAIWGFDSINFGKKKMLPLIQKELKLQKDATKSCVCRKNHRKSC